MALIVPVPVAPEDRFVIDNVLIFGMFVGLLEAGSGLRRGGGWRWGGEPRDSPAERSSSSSPLAPTVVRFPTAVLRSLSTLE